MLFKEIEGNKSLTEMIETSLERCTEDLRQEVMKNAIFCGGSSMMRGLEDRVHKELSRYGEELHITFDWQRRYSSWIGGSMIGSLSTFQNLAIVTKDNSSGNMSDSDIIRRIF
jgi:actin-related protein